MRITAMTVLATALIWIPPAIAQTEAASSRTASSSVGRVGQRQTRDQVVPSAPPMARINNRLISRVQSRINSRIDRNYNRQASSTASIERAEREVRRSPPQD
jgi:hypothetical protein